MFGGSESSIPSQAITSAGVCYGGYGYPTKKRYGIWSCWLHDDKSLLLICCHLVTQLGMCDVFPGITPAIMGWGEWAASSYRGDWALS